MKLALYGGWKLAVRSLYYVLMRVSSERGRKQLATFLMEEGQ